MCSERRLDGGNGFQARRKRALRGGNLERGDWGWGANPRRGGGNLGRRPRWGWGNGRRRRLKLWRRRLSCRRWDKGSLKRRKFWRSDGRGRFHFGVRFRRGGQSCAGLRRYGGFLRRYGRGRRHLNRWWKLDTRGRQWYFPHWSGRRRCRAFDLLLRSRRSSAGRGRNLFLEFGDLTAQTGGVIR